ncbi:MAG TPA: glycosyltransferase family 2 protein [candidate division Zixibacteria bacterium]|nr:glycosyltransferase family 2 protein [candidate division Zixibacteria bacterium]
MERVSDNNEKENPSREGEPTERSARPLQEPESAARLELRDKKVVTVPQREKRRFYIPVRTKFVMATAFATLWFGLSVVLAQPWLQDLSEVIGGVPAFLVVLFIALIPGFLNAHILASVLLDSPPPLRFDLDFPPVSLLIAAYNEAENLPETFRGIKHQDYPGKIEVILVDDGSTDGTAEVARSLGLPNLKIIQGAHEGKASALNRGLEHVTSEFVVCMDADTFLHPQALKRIMARFLTDPENTAAVAGCVLVKNSRETFMARLQEWDYFTGIASAKRQQSLYQGTLVAQGAFSAFRTRVVRQYQGWPSVIGEDIVLTWALLKDGWRIGFEPTAIGFTVVPETLRGFYRQRKRWARGMIEGLKRYGHMAWTRSRLSGFFVGIDFIIPFIDFFYAFAFLPGVALALAGHYYIVGPLTLLVIPLAFLIFSAMYRKQKKVFDAVGLKVRRNFAGFLVYMLVYQAVMSPICVIGYLQEFFGMTKRW